MGTRPTSSKRPLVSPDPIGPTPGKMFPSAPMYGGRSSDTPLVNLAFLGRVSDEDLQDPTLSIPRQLANCQAVLPPGARIVAHYWDVESGRIDPDQRGRGDAYKRFDVSVPRDGGIQELLKASTARGRLFDAVICEGIDRVARRTYYGVKIEHDLERAGLALLAADEGISNLRKRATSILTRRVKQATSEWYVLDTLEKAWDGFCEHATQGWNIGVPPYGFLGERIPHPVPAKRAEGLTKTRLVLDPVRAPVVKEMFEWRTGEKLSFQAIADRLNANSDRYPIPKAIGGTRSRGSWSALSVRSVLSNPKYTGYMVWNRRGRNNSFGTYNPPDLWVWSKEQTHPAIISLEIFQAADAVAVTRKGSRPGSSSNAHPETKRTYLLRSFVHCDICSRRMEGSTRKGSFVYFRCRKKAVKGHDPFAQHPDHPNDFYVSQDKLLAGLFPFLADRVFSAYRRDYLAVDFDQTNNSERAAWEDHVAAVERTLTDIAVRRERLMDALESTDDPAGILAKDINRRVINLVNEQVTKEEELRTLQANPVFSGNQNSELLDHLGQVTAAQLEAAPELIIRQLFETLALSVRYDPHSQLATCSVSISEDSMPIIGQATKNVVSPGQDPDELGMLIARSEGFEPPTF